jgi:hypothetical protein
MDLDKFWTYTIEEIDLFIKTNNEREMNQLKETAQLNYINSILIGLSSSHFHPLTNGKPHIPELYEVYPNLFEKPKPQQQDWRIAKERLMKFANLHNKGGGNN